MKKMKDYFKPRRVEVPMFELVSNPVISKGPRPGWFKEFYRQEAYLSCKGRLTLCKDIKAVQKCLLEMFNYIETDIIRQVVIEHFPQYKDLTDKILMLQ